MHNKKSNIQGRSLNVLKYKELLIKERIPFLWGQILSFERGSHLKRDAIEESLLDPVVSL